MSQDVSMPHIHIQVANGKPSDKTKQDQRITDAGVATSVIEEAEILHGSIKAGSVAQIVIAVIATIGVLYFSNL